MSDRADPWQLEADLLAEGRELLERMCGSPRYRHLYPEGPNLALLFEAYQELDRRRTVGRVGTSTWRQLRALRAILRDLVRADVLDRNQRLSYRLPPPRAIELTTTPDVVARALGRVEPEARAEVERAVLRAQPADGEALRRGLGQFRDALINEALSDPRTIVGLHPQFLWFVSSAQPTRRGHPIANFLFVKLPLHVLLAFVTLFNIAYLGAYFFFNDEVLGRFVSSRVSNLLDGELEMGSIHWEGRLIFDLVTGTPSPVVVEDITVWEPYKTFGGERKQRAAHADRIEATLVLHEIIPWNRIGIPTVFEIPWVLHFGEVRTQTPMWLTIRGYRDRKDDGTVVDVIGLRDAFVPVRKFPPGRKGLSFAIDDAELDGLLLELDFEATAEWKVAVNFDEADWMLRFDAPDPRLAKPIDLPLQFEVEGHGARGLFQLKDIELPLSAIELDRFRSGREGVALGDVGFAGRASAAESPLRLEGQLIDALTRIPDPENEPLSTDDAAKYGEAWAVQLEAVSPDIGGLTEALMSEFELQPGTVEGDDAEAVASITGPIADPTYRIAAQGLTLDLLQEPAWTADDVDVDVTLSRGDIPRQWRERFEPGAERMIVRFDTFGGAALDGSFRLQPYGNAAEIVMPELPGEPYLIALDLQLSGVNPERLFPGDPKNAAMLSGAANGRLAIDEMIFGPPADAPLVPPGDEPPEAALLGATLEFEDLRLVRDRGPEVDGVPKKLRVDGRVRMDDAGSIDLQNLVLAVDGGQLRADGGIEGDPQVLKSMLLDLRIDNGNAFARAFAIPSYFDDLRAQLTMFGPLMGPSANDGFLAVRGDSVSTKGEASLTLERGTLVLRAPATELFGGTGSIDAELELFRGDALAADPRVRAELDLRGIDLSQFGLPIAGTVDLRAKVGDGQGNPAPLSSVRVDGEAKAETLTVAGTTYRNATLDFTLTPDRLTIGQLVLPLHRRPSPAQAPDLTIPSGMIMAQGTIALRDDPELDVTVQADTVGLDVIGRMIDVEIPVAGRIGKGTEVRVLGPLSRPAADGTVVLESLSASGIPLGDGKLEVTSSDVPAEGPLAAHRELRVGGDLTARGQRGLALRLDAVLAIGAKPPGSKGKSGAPPLAAEVDVSLDELAVAKLLHDPVDPEKTPPVQGELEDVSAHVLTCNRGAPMLSACVGQTGGEDQSLAIDLAIERAWLRGSDGKPKSETPDVCRDPTTVCSREPLRASVDWPMIRLTQPWVLTTGGQSPVVFELRGDFDFSESAKDKAVATAPATCRPPPAERKPTRARPGTDGGRGQATFVGTIDLAAVAPLLEPYGVEMASGMIDVDLQLNGRVLDPVLSGTLALNPKSGGLKTDLEAAPAPITFQRLALTLGDGWLSAAGAIASEGSTLRFGTVRGEHTGYALFGPCAGSFGVAAEGEIDDALISALARGAVTANGSIGLRYAHVRGGPQGDGLRLDAAEGSLSLQDRTLRLEITDGLPPVELKQGRVDFARCVSGGCGTGSAEGWIAVWLGGNGAQGSSARPAEALRARIGTRGEAWAWGRAIIAPDLSQFTDTDLAVRLEDVPYRHYDASGQPAAEAELTSDDLRLVGGAPLVLTGGLELDRTRYIKDAIEGVEILRLTDDDVGAPTAQPPELIRDLRFDVRATTVRPLRVENNIASGVEADLLVNVGGTYDDPELTGRIDVEPGGKVDIPFLTGTYQIQRGRVTLQRDLPDAEVDVLALREEPIYIEGQPRTMQLQLTGTLSEIRWNCLAEGGDSTGALSTVRGCTEYLVLGAGDVQESEIEVQQYGTGGLAGARKSLSVVGHLTEFDISRRIAKAAPRTEPYLPDMGLRLGQIGPELEVRTPTEWFDFNYGRASIGWDYTRGYPGFLLRQSREITLRLEILDPITIEFSRRIRSYLNERIIFDPLEQNTLEMRFDFEIPSLR